MHGERGDGCLGFCAETFSVGVSSNGTDSGGGSLTGGSRGCGAGF